MIQIHPNPTRDVEPTSPSYSESPSTHEPIGSTPAAASAFICVGMEGSCQAPWRERAVDFRHPPWNSPGRWLPWPFHFKKNYKICRKRPFSCSFMIEGHPGSAQPFLFFYEMGRENNHFVEARPPPFHRGTIKRHVPAVASTQGDFLTKISRKKWHTGPKHRVGGLFFISIHIQFWHFFFEVELDFVCWFCFFTHYIKFWRRGGCPGFVTFLLFLGVSAALKTAS